MKYEKPAVVYELSLKEYILVFKYFMKKAKRAHATGFVKAPLLYAKPEPAEIEQLADLALKHGVLVRGENGIKINDIVYTFVNAWTDSLNVAAIKKTSYSDQKGIFFAKVEGMYLAVLQDSVKDKAVLAADSDIEVLYDHFSSEIEKKDADKQFNLKKANKAFEEQGRSCRLQVDPVNRLFLQCVDNSNGKNCRADELIHVGKKQLEEIALDDKQRIVEINIHDGKELKKVITKYIDENCSTKNSDDQGNAGRKVEDAEFYTQLSFMKLTRNEKFPKSFWGFLKMMIVNFIKSFTNWKNVLKRVGVCLLMSALTLVWNIFALCYLNDTFNISLRAVFGKATAYLLAGVADTSSVVGLPGFVRTINTVTITALLYYLLAIALRTVIGDIASGKVKSNLSHFVSFGGNVRNYISASPRGMSYYIWTGLAVASVINIAVFNPFTVLLLSIMILLSCMKCEDGGIAPVLMIFQSSVRYKSVASGKRRAPLFGECQLRLLGIGIGLIICSLVNAILWFTVNFNFWVRLAISIAIIILTFFKIGILKVSKPAAAAIFLFSIISVQLIGLLTSRSFIAFADDGGWTESGGTLAGLMQNYGWETILGFSFILAAAVAVGCLTFGLGTAAVLGASAATFATAALGSTFTETGRKAAYDFVWGNYSPYGGDSKLAAILNLGVSLVPGFGDAFGVITGIRDCSYDIKEGDWGALALDGFGFALDVHGLLGEVGDFLKHADDMADIAGDVGRNADDILTSAEKNVDDIASGAVRHGEDIVQETAGKADDIVEEIAGKSDDIAEEIAGKSDDIAKEIAGKSDDIAEEIAGKSDDIAEKIAGKSDDIAEEVAGKSDDIAEEVAGKSDDIAEEVAGKSDDIAEEVAGKSDDIAEEVAGKSDDIVEETAGKTDDIVEETAGKTDDMVEETAGKTDDIVEETAGKSDDIVEETAGKTDDIVEETAGKTDDIVEETSGKSDDIVEETAAKSDDMAEEAAGKSDDAAEQAAKETEEVTNVLTESDWQYVEDWKFKPSESLYAKYKDVYQNPSYFNPANGDVIWPPKDGFVPETIKDELMPEGTIFKRIGEPTGEFLGNTTDPFEKRALAPFSDPELNNVPQRYYRLVEDTKVRTGEVAPWFDEEGHGTQFLIFKPDGTKYTVQELLDADILEDITDLVEKGEISID